MHVIAALALDGLVLADLAGPCEIFERCRTADGDPAYEVRVCAASPEVDAGMVTVRAPWDLTHVAQADTVLVPGTSCLGTDVPVAVLDAIRSAADRGARVVSICTGVFTLAATGLLDGLRATTHWRAAAELASRHPLVEVDPGVLFVDEGRVLTSAGAAAGLDLSLHIIRADHGASAAATAARDAVMPLERAGGQAQFIARPDPVPDGATLPPLLEWMTDNLGEDLTLTAIAARARTTTRTLNRRFHEQLGTTPAQWLVRARLHHAQHLLESTDLPVELVASRAGFSSATTFRDRFRRRFDTSPRAYRQAFRAAGAPG